MRTILLVITLVATIIPAMANEMVCPKGFSQLTHKLSMAYPEYFVCDFTSGTCERGYADRSSRVFELLAPDRKTVIGHYFINNNVVFDYDKGEAKISGIRFQQGSVVDMLCDSEVFEQKMKRDVFGNR